MNTKRSVLVAAVLGLIPLQTARADFNPATGLVELGGIGGSTVDDAAALRAFGDLEFLGHDLGGVPGRAPEFVDGGIDGGAALRIDPGLAGVSFSLDAFDDTLRGRRFEIRFWYRAEGTVPFAELYYLGIDGSGLLGNPQAPFAALGVVRFWPTGRATDDGWVEMSSGPVDYSIHDRVEAQLLRIVDERVIAVAFFGEPPPTEGGALIDAIDVIDLGERAVPDVACTLRTEDVCGVDGVCFYGRCADAAMAEGSVPADPQIREEYFDRQIERIRLFAGSRYITENIEAYAQRVRAVVHAPLPELWSEYRRAHDDLADGHLSMPMPAFVSPIGTPACLYESEADLLPGAPIAPMVSQVRRGHPIASAVQIGDVLTAIDDEPVATWAARANRLIRYGGDPRGRSFITAPALIEAATRSGSKLSFFRCSTSTTTACGVEELEPIEVDTADFLTTTFNGQRGNQWFDTMPCDYRFSQAVVAPANDRDFVGHVDDADVRTIVINGVSGDRRWNQRVRAAVDGVPNKVILDERTGGGGTFEGVSALLSPFLDATANPFALVLPSLTPEIDPSRRAQLEQCQTFGGQFCGNTFLLPLATGSFSPASRPDAKIAILNGLDVSGNDFLPYALKQRSTGQTRIFGAVPTYGAFGPLFRMPRLANEVLGGSFQLQDTIFLDDETDPNATFTTGYGVEPDEVIHQKQSDAVNGVDTMLTRARAWLEETP